MILKIVYGKVVFLLVQFGLVIEASKHQNELMEDRELANNNQPPKKIATFTLKRLEAHCRTK